jgi:hypothetical protein
VTPLFVSFTRAFRRAPADVPIRTSDHTYPWRPDLVVPSHGAAPSLAPCPCLAGDASPLWEGMGWPRRLAARCSPRAGRASVLARPRSSCAVWGTHHAFAHRSRLSYDLPGPTTSVGAMTDYSVGPWYYPACATRHLMAWSTRTTKEKYSVRKLYISRTVCKTPTRTRLALSHYSDL